MRKPLVAGNWKMCKTSKESVDFVIELKPKVVGITDREILVCPPFTALSRVKEIIQASNIMLGAQNMYWEKEGAYTGEVSPAMLAEIGCQYVIIGHSERRQYFGETDETVNKKMKSAFNYGLIPIVCVGETLTEREKGDTFKVVERQTRVGVDGLDTEKASILVVAYEPVWAIGTGKTATPEQAEEVQAYIRKLLAEIYDKEIAEKIRILYGGSVKPDNVAELMKQPNIDGGLVGGASLKVDSFEKIIKF